MLRGSANISLVSVHATQSTIILLTYTLCLLVLLHVSSNTSCLYTTLVSDTSCCLAYFRNYVSKIHCDR